jgi:hypothetical protein
MVSWFQDLLSNGSTCLCRYFTGSIPRDLASLGNLRVLWWGLRIFIRRSCLSSFSRIFLLAWHILTTVTVCLWCVRYAAA